MAILQLGYTAEQAVAAGAAWLSEPLAGPAGWRELVGEVADRVCATGRWPEPGSAEEWLALAGGCLPGSRRRRRLPADIEGLIGTRAGRGVYSRRWQRLLDEGSPDAVLVRTVAASVAPFGPNVERATQQALTLLPLLAAGEVSLERLVAKARYAARPAAPRRSEHSLEIQASPRWVEASRAQTRARLDAERDTPPTVIGFLGAALEHAGASGVLSPGLRELIESDWAVACNHLTGMGMVTRRQGEDLLAAARSTGSTHEHRLGRELSDGRLARLFVGTAKSGCRYALAWWWGQWTLGHVDIDMVPKEVAGEWARQLGVIAGTPPAPVAPLAEAGRERGLPQVAHGIAV